LINNYNICAQPDLCSNFIGQIHPRIGEQGHVKESKTVTTTFNGSLLHAL